MFVLDVGPFKTLCALIQNEYAFDELLPLYMTPQCVLVVVTAADDNWDCGRHFECANNTTPQPNQHENIWDTWHTLEFTSWNETIEFSVNLTHNTFASNDTEILWQNNGDASFSYRCKLEDKTSSNTNLKDQF